MSSNRVIRGIRDKIPCGYILGRSSQGDGPVELIRIPQLGANGELPQGGGGGGGLTAIADKTILSNISGASAVPVGNGLSALLDNILGNTRGAIITRGASSWGLLGPGAAGRFLMSNGAGADLGWGSGSAVAANQAFPMMPIWDGVAGDAAASLGYAIGDRGAVPVNMTIVGVQMQLSTVAGGVYSIRGAPFNFSTSKITSAATVFGTFTEGGSAVNPRIVTYYPLAVPVTLTAGSPYLLWITRTDATSTTPNGSYFKTSALPPPWGYVQALAGYKLASTNPTTSDTWTVASAMWSASFMYTLP